VIGLHRDAKHFYSWNGARRVPGITSIIGMMDKPALVGWAQRETAIAAVRNWEQVARMVGDQPPAEESLAYHPAVAYLKAMPGYQRDSAANVGTRVHAMAEADLKGEPVDVPEDIASFVDAYRRDFLERYEPVTHPLYVECMVYHPGNDFVLPYGGTLDLICDIGDERWIIDHKTTKSGTYPETGLQLSAGANAGWIGRPGDPERYPIPPVTRYGVLWIRPEGAELIPYDIKPVEFQAFTACRLIWHWKDERSDKVKNGRTA